MAASRSKTTILKRSASIIRLALVPTAILAIVLLVVAVDLQQNAPYDTYMSVFDCIAITATAWTILWCTISLSLTLFWRPYHPGIDIGLDFLGWGLAWSLGILQLSESGSMSYDAEWSHLAGTERAGGAFVVLIGCGHLALMAMAMSALHTRRTKNLLVES